jgi:putative membrane protein
VILRKFEQGANRRSHIFYRWFNEVPVLMLVAVACVAAPSAEIWLPGNRKYAMAGVLVVYSGIRFYRVQKFKKQQQHEMPHN